MPFARCLVGLVLLGLLIGLPPMSAAGADRSLILATTTSVRDSGLLDALLPDFTKASGIKVRVIAVGTGAALRMGREGNADVLLTHAPTAEKKMVEQGFVTRRTPFMQNYFVIAGPAEDPAGVASASSAVEAIAKIFDRKSKWVSRADDSGTHKREKQLFESAGIDPDTKRAGLDRTGSGMGLSLQVAGERRAYILSDIGTFLAFQARTGLVALSKPSDALRNVYAVLQLDAARFDRPIAVTEALAFERFLIDNETQKRIGGYGVERFGRPLFEPIHGLANSVAESSPTRSKDE
jgi:tungstate transport system substrate-binding protein